MEAERLRTVFKLSKLFFNNQIPFPVDEFLVKVQICRNIERSRETQPSHSVENWNKIRQKALAWLLVQ